MRYKVTDKSSFFPDLIRKFLLSWLLAVTIEYWLVPNGLKALGKLSGLAEMSLLRVLSVSLLGTVVLFVLSFFFDTKKYERWGLAGVFAVLSASTLIFSFTLPYLVVCLLIVFALVVYALKGWDSSIEPHLEIRTVKKEKKRYLIITACVGVLLTAFLCFWTAARYLSFGSPTFDFGIFSQMFYSMKETGLPMTTVERDTLLSHFNVHVSPIYYLMLPFYMLFPSPVTLQVLQVLVVMSSIIPLWMIAERHGISDIQRMILCIAVMFLPAFTGGISYDLHENCFLAPCIMWVFYGIDRKNIAVTSIFAFLTLMIKEDAAVYAAVIGVYLIVKSLLKYGKDSRWDFFTGIGILAAALIWFALVTHYLATTGDGVMTNRYDNFIFDGSSSLATVVISVILNPMKALFECVDEEKLKYILLTMLPLLGLPFITRRYERFVFLIPYILLNLMSDYYYQHNIYYQYNFGSVIFLIYLVVSNWAEIKISWLRLSSVIVAAVLSVSLFSYNTVPKALIYQKRVIRNSDEYKQIRQTLSQIPADASVTSSTYYSAFLSSREELYDVRHGSIENLLKSDYVILNLSPKEVKDYKNYVTDSRKGYDVLTEIIDENGFEVFDEIPGVLRIYVKEK